jgi:arylsulfatase A-like enzyme
MSTRRAWTVALLVVLSGCNSQPSPYSGPTSTPPILPAKRPNIVFIMADDLGYGELGCYGSTKIKTPNIDRLAKEGIRFTQAYSGNPLCAPSRCTLLTGLHTGHCLVRFNIDRPLRPQDTTIAQVLKSTGYKTAVIGKWGLGPENTTGVPNLKGFDFFYGVLTHLQAHNFYPDFVYRNQAKERTRNVLARPYVSKVKLDYFPDLMTNEALKYLDSMTGKDTFFLYLPYTLPHVNDEEDPGKQNEVPSLGIYANKPWTIENRGHAAMITYLDTAVGKILKKLKQRGLDKNTMVVFTGDNGPLEEGGVDPKFFESSGHLRGFKRDLYEGGIRVPIVIDWPEHTPPGITDSRPIAFWDFMPTLSAAALIAAPSTDGVSFLDNILGKKNTVPPNPMYWEAYEGGYKQAVRFGNWKAILTQSTNKLELYDLAKDPSEQNDVAAHKPDVAKQMRITIKQEWTPPVPINGRTTPFTKPRTKS